MPQVTADARHDFRFWDRVAGYVDGDCTACTRPGVLFGGVCQPCWEGQDAADEARRSVSRAMAALNRASEHIEAVFDRDRLAELHSDTASLQAASANLRLAVMKKWRTA